MIQYWVYVIFKNEKQFSGDKPDGLQRYWNELRKDKTTLLKK